MIFFCFEVMTAIFAWHFQFNCHRVCCTIRRRSRRRKINFILHFISSNRWRIKICIYWMNCSKNLPDLCEWSQVIDSELRRAQYENEKNNAWRRHPAVFKFTSIMLTTSKSFIQYIAIRQSTRCNVSFPAWTLVHLHKKIPIKKIIYLA